VRSILLRLSLVLMALVPANAAAQEFVALGTSVTRVGSRNAVYLLAIPIVERSALPSGERWRLFADHRITVGIKGGFSLDQEAGVGAYWRRSPRLSFFGRASVGTFLFNNFTLAASAGAEYSLRSGDDGEVTIQAELGNRRVRELIGFISGRSWYASGRTLGVRIAVRFADVH
jgi:hypothetical protein